MARTAETLEQLEGEVWGEPTYDSYLVQTIHALRRKPVREFTVEDLRITIGQGLGLKYLTPFALSHLEAEPFSEGHFYPGDLLASVLSIPREFWLAHPGEARRVAAVARQVELLLDAQGTTDEIKSHLRALINEAPWRAA